MANPQGRRENSQTGKKLQKISGETRSREKKGSGRCFSGKKTMDSQGRKERLEGGKNSWGRKSLPGDL